VPQPPDPHALHEAALAELRRQAAAEEPSSGPAKAMPERARGESRQVAAPEGATNIFGSATGAVYEVGALALSVGWFFVRWAVVLGRKLAVGMVRAAHWALDSVTGGG
jgi:hypothetical protein